MQSCSIDPLQKLQIVDLYDHAFAHAHIRHQKWALFDVFNHYELPLHQREVLLAAELIVALAHLRIDDQVVGPRLSHLVGDELHPHPPRCQVIVEGKVEPVQLAEAFLLEGELHEVELGGDLAVLQCLPVYVFYLGLDDPLDGQVLLLMPRPRNSLAVHR